MPQTEGSEDSENARIVLGLLESASATARNHSASLRPISESRLV
jgi:hypothetical protein